MTFIDRLLRAVIAAYTAIGAVAVLLMMLHITADVIGKFIFNRPLPGTTPIVSQFYMVAVAFLPLALVERATGHISVEILQQTFPRKVQGLTQLFSKALGIVIFSMMGWGAWAEAMKKYAMGTFNYEEGLKILTWPSFFVLPLGVWALVAVLLFSLIYQLMNGLEEPAPLTSTSEEGAHD